MKRISRIFCLIASLALSCFLVTACGDDDNSVVITPSPDPTTATFQVDVENATANQPLSPPAVILHDSGFSGWQFGEPVSSGLEELAEGGDPAAFRQEALFADARDDQAGTGPVAPGETASITVEGDPTGALLTVATMLVNTNDAFAGISDMAVGDLQVGQSRSWDLQPLDAGTEENSERASTIPGPAGSGEGFNSLRDDRDFVTIHPGVVTADDGLVTSALDESHRFQGPIGRLTVTRLQ